MFKIGDKVKYINHIECHAKEYPSLGQICEIIDTMKQGILLKEPKGWWYYEDSFEPIINTIDWFALNRSVI